MKTLSQKQTDALRTLDVEKIRQDFPILHEKENGKPLIYLDNAATTQKPKSVIETLHRYYSSQNANIHRGVFQLSQKATDAYEATREKVKNFLNAEGSDQIIFVRGTTEGINLIANGFAKAYMKEGDEVLITHMEHHSNIVPWQILREERGIVLKVAPVNDAGELIWEEFEKLIGAKTKLISVAHISNAIGTINPIKTITALAHSKGIPVLVDGAQGAPHIKADVQDLGADFYVFSGHKVYGPTGVGVVYGKKFFLEEIPPYQGGGDMISAVTFEKTTYNVLPHKFEAGTPNIAGVIGLASALDYVDSIGLEKITQYENELLDYGTKVLMAIPEVSLVGTAKEKAGILSFELEGVHPHDVGSILDQEGIAIRAGHHCAMPLMERFKVPATVRASLAFYNTSSELDKLAKGLKKVLEVFK